MSSTSRAPDTGTGLVSTLAADHRVVTFGRITVGDNLTLEQEPRTVRPARRFLSGLPDDGTLAPLDHPDLLNLPGRLPVNELRWQLRPAAGQLEMADRGLCASYGIFGAPGSGKTYLLTHLFRQLVRLEPDRPDRRFGGLVLDPKAGLMTTVRTAMADAGRADDLVVINQVDLSDGNAVNVIDAGVSPTELGRILVLAAQSAGVGASEPFWFGAWRNLFTAVLPILDWVGVEVTSLSSLMEVVLLVEPTGPGGVPERRVQRIARDARLRLDELDPPRRRDMLFSLNQIDGFYRQEPDNIATVESLITTAYGGFLASAWQGFSAPTIKVPGRARTNFYDRVIEDGRVVVVSIGPGEAGMAKVLCTLVKLLFQRTVLSRFERARAGTLCNVDRPVVLMCDEYSDVASEVPGEPAGDAYFFSLARQFGCLGLIATQSVHMLQASALGEDWKAVFSNFSAKVFMRLGDNETAEEATKLAGETDWYIGSSGTSRQKDGVSASANTELRERKSLPGAVLTQVLQRQEAVVVGSLDGGNDPGTFFVRVPDLSL